MGAFKKLNKQDVYLDSYTAYKSWNVSGSQYSSYGIQLIELPEYTGSVYYLNSGDISQNRYTPLVYKSLDLLYYRTSETGSFFATGSYEHYLQTSYLEDNQRILTGSAVVISIPRDYVGNHIKPGSFELSGTVELVDNAEGSVIVSGSAQKAGDIIYQHGIVVLNNLTVVSQIDTGSLPSLAWKSSIDIQTYNVHCRIHDYEFNTTLNPTTLSGSLGEIKPVFLEPYFNPYITTVGLYNDANELLAVGKFSQPVPKSQDTEMTVYLRIGIDY
jgi:hypothetical protein